MHFAQPVYFWLLLLLPLFLWLDGHLRTWRHQAVRRFAAEKFHSLLLPVSLPRPFKIRQGIWILILLIMVFALARPQGKPSQTLRSMHHLAIYFVLDCSLSMQAQDIKPNRWTAARQVIQSLLERMPQHRAGLIGFAGQAQVLCPLTSDHDALCLTLWQTALKDFSPPGSNPAAGLDLALEKLKSISNPGKVVVMVSDGEAQLPTDWNAIGRLALQYKIKIYTIGLGTIAGGPIPLGTDFWGNPMVRIYRGKIVKTRLVSLGMRRLAKLSAGQYYPWEGIAQLIPPLLRAMQRNVSDLAKTEVVLAYYEFFPWLIVLALVLLLLEGAVFTFWRHPA